MPPDGDAARKKKAQNQAEAEAARRVFLIVTDVQAGSSEDLLTLLRCDPLAVTHPAQLSKSNLEPGLRRDRDAALVFTTKNAENENIEVLRLPDNFSYDYLFLFLFSVRPDSHAGR